jgi:ribose-phosphate pyrophosphokinase
MTSTHQLRAARTANVPMQPMDYSAQQFAGGEVQVRIAAPDDTPAQHFEITTRLHEPAAVMELLLLTDALRRMSVGAHIRLICPYLPYARQDRVCAPGEALSLKVMTDLINAQHYQSVEVWDAHSDVAGALLDRVVLKPALHFVQQIALMQGATKPVLVAPDAGALKKVSGIAQALGAHWVRADKSRDAKTGAITGTVVYSEHIGSQDFLIVDDICDGGRTFIALAEALRPLTTGGIYLYITHGIFSSGYEALAAAFDGIYTANSFRPLGEHPKVIHL